MKSTVVNHTYKLKRGKEEAVNRANPLLLAGEPIVVYCNDGFTRLKIGDGVHYYNELSFIGEDSSAVFSAHVASEFPKVGNPNTIYKASSERLLYQWNPYERLYEIVGGLGDSSGTDIVVDDHLSLESTNPVQNKIVAQELYKKVDTEDGKGLSTNDYTTEEKVKLAGVESGATKVIVDLEGLNIDSSNAISNGLVTQALNNVDAKIQDIDSKIEQTVSQVVDEKIEMINLDGGEI